MISSVTRLRATALFTSVLLSSAMPASATLKPCYPALAGVGRGPDMYTAMKKAIFSWRMNAQDAYGAYFDDYRLAEKLGRSCKETGGLFYCRITAQPCKSEKPTGCVSCKT